MIEKQSIINLCSNSSKNYVYIGLSNSEVPFLLEGEDAVFCLFLYCVLFIDRVAKSKKDIIKFLCLLKFLHISIYWISFIK